MSATLSFLQLHRFDSPPSSGFSAGVIKMPAEKPPVSLRLGHGAALTAPRAVIHYRAAASLPQKGKAKSRWMRGRVETVPEQKRGQ